MNQLESIARLTRRPLGHNKMYKRILIIIFLLIGCSPDDYEPDRSLGVIPLCVDNSWHYESSTYDSTGELLSTEPIYLKVIESIIINNTRWYITEKNWSGICSPNDTNVNQSSGCYGYQHGETYIVYKYPVLVNEEYIFSPFLGQSRLELTRVLTSLDTTITIPAGTFQCLNYHTPGVILSPEVESLESNIFIDCSVGIIRYMYSLVSGKR